MVVVGAVLVRHGRCTENVVTAPTGESRLIKKIAVTVPFTDNFFHSPKRSKLSSVSRPEPEIPYLYLLLSTLHTLVAWFLMAFSYIHNGSRMRTPPLWKHMVTDYERIVYLARAHVLNVGTLFFNTKFSTKGAHSRPIVYVGKSH